MEGIEPEGHQKLKAFFKKMGIGAFLFFFIKGLVWIAVFLGLGKLIGC